MEHRTLEEVSTGTLGHNVEGKNDLENYCFTMHDFLESLRGQGLVVLNATLDWRAECFMKGYGVLNATLDWLDENQLAEGHEFKAKQKELEKVVNQIMLEVIDMR